MKKILISTALLLCLAELPLKAQVCLNVDVNRRIESTGDYYSDYLATNTYADDDSYFAVLLNNPFYRQTADISGLTGLDVQLTNGGIPLRDNYFGLATWTTTADFDHVSVTTKDGKRVYSDDFTKEGDEWNPNGGAWTVADGVLRQTDAGNLGSINVCYQRTGYEGTLEVDATKRSGAEGFLLAFSYVDDRNYVWWNIGGWGNTQHAIEQCVDGVKNLLATAPGSVVTGQTYRLKVVMEGQHVRCYMDGSLIHDIVLANSHTLYGAATVNSDDSQLRVRITNPDNAPQKVIVRLKNTDLTSTTWLRRQVSGSMTEDVLQNLDSSTPQRSTLSPVQDYALVFNAPARSLNTLQLGINGNWLTGIEAVKEDDAADHEGFTDRESLLRPIIYDLQGRRIPLSEGEQLPRGLYIIGGKKVFIDSF